MWSILSTHKHYKFLHSTCFACRSYQVQTLTTPVKGSPVASWERVSTYDAGQLRPVTIYSSTTKRWFHWLQRQSLSDLPLVPAAKVPLLTSMWKGHSSAVQHSTCCACRSSQVLSTNKGPQVEGTRNILDWDSGEPMSGGVSTILIYTVYRNIKTFLCSSTCNIMNPHISLLISYWNFCFDWFPTSNSGSKASTLQRS